MSRKIFICLAMMRREIMFILPVAIRYISLGFFITIFYGCQSEKKITPIQENEVPLHWADMTLYITKNTPANSPTFASRALGYIGLTMYESIVHGYEKCISLAGQLNGLKTLPFPDQNKPYNWAVSLNAGQAQILKSIYIQTSDQNKIRIDSLENAINDFFVDHEKDKDIIERSVSYGRAVAEAIFEWSKTDGGHRGYLFNFDDKAQFPTGKENWKPPFFAQTISRFPLHPHWGKNRVFVPADTNWQKPDFILYDLAKQSACYKEFITVYEVNKNLTQEQKEIAMWWNDDPSDTYTPPGHSYNLASIVIRNTKPEMIKAAQTYARTGLAVADAFIICWKLKYDFYTVRPSGFINENIDDEWEPFWPDPPFPAFPSGHATQAAAVAVVLSGLYGDTLHFTDDSHSKRPRDPVRNVDYKPRRFNSFWQVAEETAYSRLLGGIHTSQDNEIGLKEGSKIGRHVNSLKWAK